MDKQKTKRQLSGTVVSNSMTKTIVVEVSRRIRHAKYLKIYTRSRKFKVHAPDESSYKIGESVLIEECRPLSKDKNWRVIKKNI